MGKPMLEPINPYIHALICQIRAIRDHASNPASGLTPYEKAAIEGSFVEAAAFLRTGRNVANWRAYRPDPRNGTVFVQEVEGFEGPNGEGPATTFFDVMHEAASGDSYGTCESYVTREAAEAAALREAIQRNAVYEPGEPTIDGPPTSPSSFEPEGGAA